MNYFEIINAILLELNYTQVNAFNDLTKLEHKRIMDIVNRINKEVCNLDNNFSFRQVIKNIEIYADKQEYDISFAGKILKITGEKYTYEFENDYEKLYQNISNPNKYSIYGEKIVFPKVNDNIKIFYLTNSFVKDKSENLKENFELETDKSIIPNNFTEKIFINGGAYNFKQNTSHPKYVHWKQEYDKAISELLSSSKKIASNELRIDGGFRKL